MPLSPPRRAVVWHTIPRWLLLLRLLPLSLLQHTVVLWRQWYQCIGCGVRGESRSQVVVRNISVLTVLVCELGLTMWRHSRQRST